MKGITPVVAIILLLLITISMVGFAFVWFSRISQQAGEQVSGELNQTLSQIGQKIRIEGVSGTDVTLRSTGGSVLPQGSVALLIDGNVHTSGNCPSSSMGPSSVFSCTLDQACSSGSTLRATAPGNFDEVFC